MAKAKSWREGAAGQPAFPENFEVTKKAVLQVTDIKDNRNKYYGIELHVAKNKFRVYTHYGRTDDLDKNPNAGVKESRYFESLGPAEACYQTIYKEKTSARKGYKELSLASTKIGSSQSVGKSSGEIDEQTLQRMAKKETKVIKRKPSIPAQIQELVGYLYSEATNALTSTVNASITANGIETPVGVLTIGQIEKGQAILDSIVGVSNKNKLVELSGDFYTLIPHKFGRTRAAASEAIINSAAKIQEKQDTLQLMRDMLNVNGDTNVLINPEVEQKYSALNCTIQDLTPTEFKSLKTKIESSAIYRRGISVKNIWKIARKGENQAFDTKVGNNQQLFHGSSAKNWLGILSRGLLLPKTVVSLGVRRTDAGWLGNGIYFGNAICTSHAYAGAGRRKTKFVTVASVALGKMKKYSKITYGLNNAPKGFHSAHGVRGTEFHDDEFVVYNQNQQKLEYLVELNQ